MQAGPWFGILAPGAGLSPHYWVWGNELLSSVRPRLVCGSWVSCRCSLTSNPWLLCSSGHSLGHAVGWTHQWLYRTCGQWQADPAASEATAAGGTGWEDPEGTGIPEGEGLGWAQLGQQTCTLPGSGSFSFSPGGQFRSSHMPSSFSPPHSGERSASGRPARVPARGCCGGPSCRPSSSWPPASGRCSTSRASLKPRNWCRSASEPRGLASSQSPAAEWWEVVWPDLFPDFSHPSQPWGIS